MKSSNTAPLAVAYWDLDGRLLFLNDRAVKNLGGTSPEEFLGKSLAETFGDEAGGVYLARIRKAAGSQAGMAGASPIGCGEHMAPLLPPPPPHPLGCHRPRVSDRSAMNAILLVLRTGMQWAALNVTGICSSSSAHRRFQEWERAGVFCEFSRQGLLEYDEQVGIDWDFLSCEGAMTKAPLGQKRTGPQSHR